MRRAILFFALLIYLFDFDCGGYADDTKLIELKGISVGMKKSRLLESWGYPAKRDPKNRRKETWFYLDAETPNPTDGIVVELYKGKVSTWRMVDNIYKEMSIWVTP